MIRAAQALLLVAALALWGASRMTWVDVSSFDGLGQPRTTPLAGSGWSTALVPLALLVAAAAAAALAVRGWPLRVLSVVIAAASAGMGYLGLGPWVITDVSVRAAELARVPLTALVGTQRHYAGAVLCLVAAVATLIGAVLLIRAATRPTGDRTRYAAPAVRRAAARAEGPGSDAVGEAGGESAGAGAGAEAMSERMLWDALDEGRDPTGEPGPEDARGR